PAPHTPQTRAARARLLRRQGASQGGRRGPLGEQQTEQRPRHGAPHGRVYWAEYGLDPGMDMIVSYVRGSHHRFLLHHGGVGENQCTDCLALRPLVKGGHSPGCFPCVAMAMWIEAGTLPLSRSGVEPSLQKL